jgi:hypothetical protein
MGCETTKHRDECWFTKGRKTEFYRWGQKRPDDLHVSLIHLEAWANEVERMEGGRKDTDPVVSVVKRSKFLYKLRRRKLDFQALQARWKYAQRVKSKCCDGHDAERGGKNGIVLEPTGVTGSVSRHSIAVFLRI